MTLTVIGTLGLVTSEELLYKVGARIAKYGE